MKKSIHPKYLQITIKCACGATFDTGSTRPDIQVEICSDCHPFFTGEMRFVDTMGRVEKYRAKQEKAKKAKAKTTKKAKASKQEPQSLKDALQARSTQTK